MVEDIQFRILVVDDDISDLNALNHILKSAYTVYFAKSGQEAIKRAVQNKPDIILLDVVMPDMNGYEVISELKKTESRDIPVIFITSLNEVNDELKGFGLGAVDYITKPFHSAIVKARIESHLKTAKLLREKDNLSIPLKTRQVLRRVKLRELAYVSVSGHWIHFHLADDEVVEVYASLREYEEILLVEPQFEHCHKSFIVNMDFVSVVEVRDVVMKNGARLPISKRYSDFKKHYEEWINGTMG